MIKPSLPANEDERLEAVDSYELMGTMPEKDFDDIASIASEICQAPISLITLVGENQQWLKAHHGTELEQTPREIAFCSYAILEPDRPFVIPDARIDDRFRDNPLVTGPTQVTFYASVSLVNPEGFPLGTLCVIDHKPNQLSERQLATLQALANTVSQMFELRRKVKFLELANKKLEDLNQEVSEVAYVLSHDLKSPLNSIVSLMEIFKDENGGQLDDSGMELLEMLQESAINLNDITKGTIQYLSTTRSISNSIEEIDVHELMVQLLTLLRPPQWVHITYPTNIPIITSSRVALQHILLNLIDNAIKYNDKEFCEIKIDFSQEEKFYHFSVTDNGPGIEDGFKGKIFKLFQTLGKTDRQGKKGTGLGLPIVKRMVEKLGGKISTIRPASGGIQFSFSILKKPI
ncbi:MAG: GAF domain-containing protein [Bacteroidetes bacterium]|nr:GAF domain-containing protein [Bacteroidota bacterium]